MANVLRKALFFHFKGHLTQMKAALGWRNSGVLCSGLACLQPSFPFEVPFRTHSLWELREDWHLTGELLMVTTASILRKGLYQNWIKQDALTGSHSLWEIWDLLYPVSWSAQYTQKHPPSCGALPSWPWGQSQNPACDNAWKKNTKN